MEICAPFWSTIFSNRGMISAININGLVAWKNAFNAVRLRLAMTAHSILLPCSMCVVSATGASSRQASQM